MNVELKIFNVFAEHAILVKIGTTEIALELVAKKRNILNTITVM